MEQFALLDLDNCISDDGWRIPKINFQKKGRERYEVYHTLAPFDKFMNSALVADLIRNEIRIVVMTGRPVLFYEATMMWLKKHHIPIHAMLMRNNNDNSTAHILKRAQLLALISEPEYGVDMNKIVAAYDDHNAVIEMYRSYNLNAQRTWVHNIDAYVNPHTGERHE